MKTEVQLLKENRLRVEAREKRKAALLKRRLEYDAAKKKHGYRRRILSIIGWSAVALGGVSLLASAYYGLKSIGPTDAVESAPRDTPWVDVNADYDTAESYKTNARILGVAGGVLTVVGAIVTVYCHKFLKPSIDEKILLTGDKNSLSLSFSTSF